MRHVVHLAQFCTCYDRTCFLAAFQVLKYLHTTREKRFALVGGGAASHWEIVHTLLPSLPYPGSDWAVGYVNRKSSGNANFKNGDLIAGFTHKQPAAFVSYIEAEHMVISYAFKDGLNVYYILNEFMQVTFPIPIRMDNQGTVYMAINLVTNNMSKHNDLRYRLMRDFANKWIIKP